MGADSQAKPDGFAPRLALFYAGFFLAAGLLVPFFPAWLAAQGLNSEAIGLVLATPLAARVVAVPVITRVADRVGALRGILTVMAIATAAGYVLVGLAHGFLAILALVALASIAYGPTMPLADAYALRGLALRGRSYGRVRLWGSAAFIAANLVGGLALDLVPRPHLIWLIVAGLCAMAAAALALAPLGGSGPPPSEHTEPQGRSGRLRTFLAVAIGASLIQASHSVYYGFSTIAWTAQGLEGPAIGALWGLGVLAEIVLFALSARLPGALGPLGLIGPGAGGAVVRWGAMALGPPVAILPALQCLHGLSFGATHLGTVQFLARSVAENRRATAQGDFTTILAMVTALSMSLSGALYGAYGAQAYAAMAAIAAAGWLAAAAACRQRVR
jgi:PPP family 3-phenylpropionic acid transporter